MIQSDPLLQVDSPVVSVKCALFLLSQVFLVLSHPPLVKQLKLYICFEENPDLVRLTCVTHVHTRRCDWSILVGDSQLTSSGHLKFNFV